MSRSGLHPVLQQLYANRDVDDPAEVEYSLERLHDYRSFLSMDTAVERLAVALREEQSVMIVGDYDADGATSTAVMVRSLRSFGHQRVDYIVPNRFEYGYGLTPEIVDVAAASSPDLIITVDNGISSVDGVRRATEHGIDVVITDHHLPGDEAPQAIAIVNPNQRSCLFPSKSIAGVGVAFYTMLALRARLVDEAWFDTRGLEVPNMANLLDIVALGTVADVVPLDANNRILVEQGIRRIRRRQTVPAIESLLTVSGRDIERCTSQDLAFYVAPRLNAAGRLTDMQRGIESLVADDMPTVRPIVDELHRLNLERRSIETSMLEEAQAYLEDCEQIDEGAIPSILCLYDERWHQGVIGLLASRLKEQYYRPVIAFADAGDGEIKGSARSIPGLHVRDLLDAIAKKHPELISKFGGHAMAAGLSIRYEDLDRFRAALTQEAEMMLGSDDLQRRIISDGVISPDDLTLELAGLLERAGPWGQRFPEPVFDDEFILDSWKIVGERHLKLVLSPSARPDMRLDAIAFGHDEQDLPRSGNLRVAYRLSVNRFNVRESLQLIVVSIDAV